MQRAPIAMLAPSLMVLTLMAGGQDKGGEEGESSEDTEEPATEE